MTRPYTQIRQDLIQQFNLASDYTGGSTQHERDVAHYEHGRKVGLAQALELVDAVARSERGRPARRRRAEEIVAAVAAEPVPLH